LYLFFTYNINEFDSILSNFQRTIVLDVQKSYLYMVNTSSI